MKFSTLTILLTAGAILSSCVTAPQTDGAGEDVASSAAANTASRDTKYKAQTEESAVQDSADNAPSPPDPVEIPIPDDSIYPLLAAEFALRERNFDYALELLFEQSMILDDPELARRSLKLAEFRERDDLALQLAMRLTALDPDDALAALTAMSQLIQAGQTETAIEYARDAKRRGSRINAPALLANFDRLSPSRRAAIAVGLEGLAAEFPEDNDIAVAIALIHREQGQIDASLNKLTEVHQRDPEEERSLVLWSQIKAARGDTDAFERIEQAIDENPEAQTLRLQYARLLASQPLLDAARRQFEILLEQSPRNGDYLFSLALIEMEAKNAAAANENLHDLIALGQRVDEAHYFLGRVAEEQLDIDAAINAYSQVGPSREFTDAKRRQGRLLLDDGNLEGFSEAFKSARQQSPGQAERLYMLQANLLDELDRAQDAIDVYTDALAIFTESLPLQYARAMTHERLGDIASAEHDLRAIISREPDNATTLNALGYTLTVHTTRYHEAAELIERALQLSPGEAAILDSLGWVYFKMHRLDEAAAYLEKAYRLLPDAEVAAHLGETLWALGRTDDALAIWQDSIARQPDSVHVRDVMQRLGVERDQMGGERSQGNDEPGQRASNDDAASQ